MDAFPGIGTPRSDSPHGANGVAWTKRVLVVTASDSRFLPFLRGMLASMRPALAAPNVTLACFDIGLSLPDRAWLSGLGVALAVPSAHFGLDAADHPVALRSFLARPFLPEYFPGYDVYLWIDSDIWLQDPCVLSRYVLGALEHGMAITHERDRGYRFQPWLFGWTTKHFLLGYGPVSTAYLLTRRHLNAGFFAIRADAPHWDGWARRYEAAIRRTGALVPHDQFALNQALYGRRSGKLPALSAAFLDPSCNWICDRGPPMWNDQAGAYCKPYPPYDPIGAMHLAGPAKRTAYRIRRTEGGEFTTYLLQGSGPGRPTLLAPGTERQPALDGVAA